MSLITYPPVASVGPAKSITSISKMHVTPGKAMSERQKKELSWERFTAVLGKEIIDQWGVDWLILGDDTVAFDNAKKRLCLKSILSHMDKVKRADEDFHNLYGDISIIKRRMDFVHLERLEDMTTRYFLSKFSGASVLCTVKGSGVQLGTKAVVTLLDGEILKYHVKTHSAGCLSSQSLASKLVNPVELMVYRLLEYTGFGCETHFIQRSPEDVYISTLDAGHGGSFSVFAEASVGVEESRRSLWGRLQAVLDDESENNVQSVEKKIEGDRFSQNFIVQVAAMDLLSRILWLHDLLNNTDNFGFLMKEHDLPHLKVIDFRVSDSVSFKASVDNFRGFLVGNGLFNYAATHETLRFVLRNKPKEQRVKTALYVLTEGPLSCAHQSLDRAYQDISEYIRGDVVFAGCAEDLMKQLNQYYEAIKYNITMFTEMLENSIPDDNLPHHEQC